MATFAFVFAAGGCWVLATPIFASPDEPSHVIHALALARGELVGRDVPPREHRLDVLSGDAEQYVTVPRTYRDWGGIDCLKFRPEAIANCLDLDESGGDAQAITYTARYFPAYYALVGFGADWYPAGAGQVYLMRFITLAVAAALLASCAASLAAVPTPFGALGVFSAVTPMALFMAGSVNGSGIEIAAATGMWCQGALLVTSPRSDLDLTLVRRAAVAMSILCVTRPLSPGWAIFCLLALAWLAGSARWRELVRLRGTRVWGALAGSAVLVQVAWFVWQRPLDYQVGPPAQGSTAEFARIGFGRVFALTQQMIGVFGWLDTMAPSATYVLVLAVVSSLVAIALLLGPTRASIVVGIAILATIIVPIIAEIISAPEHGFIWQGRYTLPIAVAVPIVAGVSVRTQDRMRSGVARVCVVLAGALVLAHTLAFAQALRRYAVGSSGPVWFFDAARWTPPVPSLALVALYLATLTALVFWWGRGPSAGTAATEVLGPEGAARPAGTAGPEVREGPAEDVGAVTFRVHPHRHDPGDIRT